MAYLKFQALKDDGTPLANGKVYTYAAGTNTAKTTYSDTDLSVENTWPVVLDAAGRAVRPTRP